MLGVIRAGATGPAKFGFGKLPIHHTAFWPVFELVCGMRL